MDFLNTWFLAGMAGIAVPIIIHLLNRYRPRTVDWAAMEFLRRAMAVRSRQIRIQDLILLLLRCLAIILIALAMARPVLKPSGPKWLSGQSYAGVVIAIDASYSMDHKAGVASRFDKAIERTRDILKTVDPGKPVSMVLMGNRTRTVFRNVGYDPTRFEQALATARPLPERLNLELCLEEIVPLVKELNTPIRECYIVSDGQVITWGNTSDTAAVKMREITAEPKNHLYFIRASDDGNENLAITDLSLASGALYKNSVARYVAHVRNFGTLPQDNVSVKLLQDGVGVDAKTIDRIGPGESRPVELYTQFNRSGAVRLAAVLGEDPLPDDNARYATAEVRDQVRVLCIHGDNPSRPEKGETFYLEMALAARAGPGKSAVQVRTVARNEMTNIKFAEYDIVVLADVPGLDTEAVASLDDFVERGGGLMIFPGRDVNAAAFNLAMKTHAADQGHMAPLLPAELQDLIGSETDRSKGWPIAAVAVENPIAALVGLQPHERLDEGKIHRAFQLRLLPEARPLLKFSAGDSCFLAERRHGRGKVLMFASSAGLSWNDLPLSPVYLMILQQAATYLTRPPQEQPFTVGNPVAIALPREVTDASVTFRDSKDKPDIVPVMQDPKTGQLLATLPEARTPGFYEIAYAKDTPPIVTAANVDSLESDVTSLKVDALRTALAGRPIDVLDDSKDVLLAIQQKRLGRELWLYLMLGGLIAMATEAVLARAFSRKVHGGAADALVGASRRGLVEQV